MCREFTGRPRRWGHQRAAHVGESMRVFEELEGCVQHLLTSTHKVSGTFSRFLKDIEEFSPLVWSNTEHYAREGVL